MNRSTVLRWLKRFVYVLASLISILFLVVLPLAGSYFITNSRFHFPERGPKRPEDVGITVTNVEFKSEDGLSLRGWWNPGDETMPVILFCHGLNRSRLEMLERAAESNRRGYGVLLFDVRNHGESENAYTTLGIRESRDVCAAHNYATAAAGNRPQVLWGVSMGASTALLAAQKCPGFAAVVSDSSFLSFRETISHHLGLAHLPAFPIANLVVALTGWRMGFDPDEGDVEAAVRGISNVPVLFIAGSADRRMPPATAERLRLSSQNSMSELLVISGAGHGEAFSTDPKGYLDAVFAFLLKVSKAAS